MVEVEFDAAVAIDDRLDRAALLKADADASWTRARVSGIELTERNERMLERRWLRRLTELGRQPVPYDSDAGGTPQDSDRVRAPLWNFGGPPQRCMPSESVNRSCAPGWGRLCSGVKTAVNASANHS